MRLRNDRGPFKQNIRLSLAGKVSYCDGTQGKFFLHVTTLMTYVSLYKVYEHLHISVNIDCLIVFYSMSLLYYSYGGATTPGERVRHLKACAWRL